MRFFSASVSLCFLLLFGSSAAIPQDLDGPSHIFHDTLLDNLVGSWNLSGKVMGRNADHLVEADWALNHQFLRIHEEDRASAAEGRAPYEAIVMVGYDNTSERYVAHWIDVYGGRFSETLGYGTRSGDEVRFVFEYPDGPFHTTFRWLPEARQWNWHMQTRDKSGSWTDFANFTLTRTKPS